MRSVILDTETTIRNVGDDAVGTFAGNPHSPKNFIVALGELTDDAEHERLDYDATGVRKVPFAIRRAASGVRTQLVGHNLGFDLLYLMKTWPEEMEKALPHLYIWDTQQVEYLLSGQSELYPSLDHCCIKRGLPVKDDEIKALWKQGVDTPLHPKDKLLNYLSGDLHNTRSVWLSQVEEVEKNPALRELVYVKMDDLLATINMEWNGMKFDLERAYEKLGSLDTERIPLYNSIMEVMKPMFPEDFECLVSPDQISLVLFGGKWKYEKRMVVMDLNTGRPVVYKSGAKKGQTKTRMEKVEFKVKGLGFKPKELGIPPLKNGNWSTDSEYLEKIDHPFAKDVVAYRELDKDAETYYRGYSSLVWWDGCIHPSINHESTRTGRQSMSSPNLQNVTKDDE